MAQLVGPHAQDTPQLTMRWELELGTLGSVPCSYPGADAPASVMVVTGRGTVIRIDGAGREVFRRDLGEQTGVAPAVADVDGDAEACPPVVGRARGVDASAARALRREALDAIAARQDAVDALSRCIIDCEMDFAAVQRYQRLLAEAIVELGA